MRWKEGLALALRVEEGDLVRSAGDPEGLGQSSVDSKGTGTQPHLTDHCACRAVRRQGSKTRLLGGLTRRRPSAPVSVECSKPSRPPCGAETALESCQAAPTPSTHHARQKHGCSLAKTHVRICTPAPLRVTQTWKPAGQNEQPREARSSGSAYRSSGRKAGWRGCGVGWLGPASHGDQG